MNENRDLNQRENGINPSELSGKGDYYFSNGGQERTPRTTPVGTKRKPAKKGNGVKSTYVFFIVVIAVSMALSVYAVFCMNDILAITKTKSTVTVSMQEEVKTASDAIDLLADQGLIKCKGFCKFFATLHDKVLNDPIGGPYPAGVYYLNVKMGLEGMLQTLQGSSATSETVTLIFPEGMTVPEIVNKLTEKDKAVSREMIKDPDKVKVSEGARILIGKLAEASAIRASQADSIAKLVAGFRGGGVIVCGDFNDSPLSYAHRVIGKELDDAFVQSGNGFGISYNQNHFYFRIDHILLSKNLESYQCTVDKTIKSSDHYPIWCFVAKK